MLDYRWSHSPPTYQSTVTSNWYQIHTVPKFGLQSTGACHCTLLKPATLVRDEFCKDFHDSCGTRFGGVLSTKNLLLCNFEDCSARKYIAFINDFKACVCTCQARDSRKDLSKKVAKAMTKTF